MTETEIEKSFGLSRETICTYVKYGLLRKEPHEGATHFLDSDVARLGLIDILLKAGFSMDGVKQYLKLADSGGNDEVQIRMLRQQRKNLLDNIHCKQQILDSLDYIIWNKKKGTET